MTFRHNKSTKKTKHKLGFMRVNGETDKLINLAVIVLMILGIFMIVSTSVGAMSLNEKRNTFYVISTLIKQSIFAITGYGLILLLGRYFKFKRFVQTRWILFIFLCILMLLPFFSSDIGGAHAWIRIGPISIQPSEFTKPFLILMVASAVYKAQRNQRKSENFTEMMKGPIFAFFIVELLIIVQKDIGTATIVAGIAYFCMMVPSSKKIRIGQGVMTFFVLTAFVLCVYLFGFTDIGTKFLSQHAFTAHIADRIDNTKNPFVDTTGKGFQPANSLYGIADGGLRGKGYGNSNRKYGYVTQIESDYILVVVIEELGIAGFGLIVGMYFLIEYRLFYYAFRTRNTVYRTILVGNGVYLFLHFLLNVGGVGAFIPMTGIPLLFVSSGGSSIMAMCCMLGVSQRCIRTIRSRELKS